MISSSFLDCVVPLGLESGQIKDSQITASSYWKNNLPKYARLGISNKWCANIKKKTEYLQIDLGKVCESRVVTRVVKRTFYSYHTL